VSVAPGVRRDAIDRYAREASRLQLDRGRVEVGRRADPSPAAWTSIGVDYPITLPCPMETSRARSDEMRTEFVVYPDEALLLG